jgi:hypothetical protein
MNDVIRFTRIGALAALLLLTTNAALAGNDHSPRELGGFSGAMKYCEEHHGSGSSRYKEARRRAAGEVNGMSRKDKQRAIEARDSVYERGRFYGRTLDRRECRSLLQKSEWARYGQ